VATPFGEVLIEEFELGAARKMDIVFFAVGGDFSKQFAQALSQGVSRGQYEIPPLCVMHMYGVTRHEVVLEPARRRVQAVRTGTVAGAKMRTAMIL
jgi:hypothetical protein